LIHTGSLESDASRKIAKIEYDYNNNPVRIQFTNGIDKYQFDEGYCQASAAGSVDYFDSYYYDRDHLGNVRRVIEPYGTNKSFVIQTMDYYPFGAEFCDNSIKNFVQNHKYNGKEFDHMHGLNTYDYGARQYNPVTGRWDRIGLIRSARHIMILLHMYTVETTLLIWLIMMDVIIGQQMILNK